ncbi:MAG: hypothetical protein ACXQS7_05630 [Candidatus Syntropharchaeia archaeon]
MPIQPNSFLQNQLFNPYQQQFKLLRASSSFLSESRTSLNLSIQLWKQLNGSSTDRKKELADLFSVSIRTIESWTRDLREKEKEEQEQRIFELWLSCWSQEEIAEELGVSQAEISRAVNIQKRKFSQMNNDHPTH